MKKRFFALILSMVMMIVLASCEVNPSVRTEYFYPMGYVTEYQPDLIKPIKSNEIKNPTPKQLQICYDVIEEIKKVYPDVRTDCTIK